MEEFNILVADDTEVNLAIITNYLEYSNYGFKVLHAHDGKEALQKAKQKLPDVIIMDWMMPKLTGIEVIRELKIDPRTVDIPVIITTGKMMTADNLKEAFNAGALDYVRKPLNKVEFTARVRSAVNLAKSTKQIKSQKDELLKMNKTKDKFLSVISHDLRGPIGNVNSLINVVLEDLKGNVSNDIIDTMSLLKESIITSYNLLDNLLMWARNNSGRLIFKPEIVDFNFLVDEVVELYEPSAHKKGIKLGVEVSDNIEIYADENMLLSILRNLVSNAIKYTGFGGSVSIKAGIEGANLVIHIIDTGLGIREEVQRKIFNPSYFYTTKGTDYEVGSGIGLLICKEFVSIHNGYLKLVSESGKGSTFIISLPLQNNEDN